MPRSAWVIAMSIRSSGATKDSWPPIGQWPAEFLIEPNTRILTPTFMKSLLWFSRVGWDHKPRDWSAGLRPGAIANRRGSSVPGRRPALRFMESLLSLPRMHWDHEPTPSPSLEGNFRGADGCLLPSWEGSEVGRFMERARGSGVSRRDGRAEDSQK